MKRLLAVVVGFAHDFAAGLWAAAVLAVAWLDRAAVPPAAREALDGLERQLFWIGVGCVVLVMATGAGRTFTYVSGVYGADAERARRRALIVKHVVLVVIFATGTFWQGWLAFR